MNIPFGKHIGTPVEELPKNYLHWLVANVKLKGALKTEIYDILNLIPPKGQEELLEEYFNCEGD